MHPICVLSNYSSWHIWSSWLAYVGAQGSYVTSVQCTRVSIHISICNCRWIFTGEGVKACRHPGSPKVPTGSELTRFHTAHHTSIIHTHTFPSFALLNIVFAPTAHTHHTSILHNYLYVHRNHHTDFHSTHIILHFIALPLDNELPFAITFLTTLLFHYIPHYTPHFH